MKIEKIIGDNLKKNRKKQNLTLKELSKSTNISTSMLSQIERGKTNPSVNNILKLAKVMNVPYSALLEENKESSFITSFTQLLPQTSENNKFKLYNYLPYSENNFEIFLMEIGVSMTFSSTIEKDILEKYIFLISGNLTIETVTDIYNLVPYDFICLKTPGAHSYINSGKTSLHALIINVI